MAKNGGRSASWCRASRAQELTLKYLGCVHGPAALHWAIDHFGWLQACGWGPPSLSGKPPLRCRTQEAANNAEEGLESKAHIPLRLNPALLPVRNGALFQSICKPHSPARPLVPCGGHRGHCHQWQPPPPVALRCTSSRRPLTACSWGAGCPGGRVEPCGAAWCGRRTGLSWAMTIL